MDVVFTTTTSSRLDALPILNGQIIALSDRSGYYYDHANKRYQVGGITVSELPPKLGQVSGSEGSLYVSLNPPGLYIFADGDFHSVTEKLVIETSGDGNVVTSVAIGDDFKLKVTKDLTAASSEALQNHIDKQSGNPHKVTKEDVGLDKVENTADKDKEVKTATKLKTQTSIFGVNYDGSADIRHDAICTTAAGTVAKTATITGFELVEGAHIYVTFQNGNTASSPTLSVNGTTAAKIVYNGANVTDSKLIKANAVLGLIYHDNAYHISEGIDTTYGNVSDTSSGLMSSADFKKLKNVAEGATANTPYASNPAALGTASPGKSNDYARGDHVHPVPSNIPASKLVKPAFINGLSFDGSTNVACFATCPTEGEDPNKVVTIPCDVQLENLLLVIKFTSQNENLPVTLKVNEFDPYPIYMNGVSLTNASLLSANSLIFVIFTGSYFEIIATSYLVASTFSEGDREKLDSVEWNATSVKPATTMPAGISTEAAIGDSDEYARADHVHAFEGEVAKAQTADKLSLPRTIKLEGDVQGSAEFDGSDDVDTNTICIINYI